MEMMLDLHTVSVQLQDNRPITLVRNTDDWKKGGRLLSGLLASNVMLLGGALATCVFTEDNDIYEFDFLIFLSIMMVICILWMLFQMYFTWKHKNAVLFKDCQAGPIWMRAGIILFGGGTLVMAALKIVFATEHIACREPLTVIQPIIQALFVIVQTCFLWISCKHCVQIHINATRVELLIVPDNCLIFIVTLIYQKPIFWLIHIVHVPRCFLMILLAVNLIIWIIAVAEESNHHTHELEKHLMRNESEDTNSSSRKQTDEFGQVVSCECNSRCINATVFTYLYPFNIEYNLFAAAMVYIMWKNVGRQIDENASFHHGLGPGFHQHIPLIGLTFGVAILVIGLVMFIMYEVGIHTNHMDLLSLTTFFIFHVVSLALMCLANVAGIVIFKLDKRKMDNKKNPSRTLDTALLLGATLGQYAISYYSIIAVVSTKPFSVLCGLTLGYSMLMILQHSIQNAFIIQGLHRLPPHVSFRPPRPMEPHETIRQVTAQGADRRESPTGVQNNFHRRMTRRETLNAYIKSHLKKRKTMKDIYLFLFLTNIIFWIMPAFGARIRFDDGLEVDFYGFTLWAIITNVCLPFGIFYRMHAAASLLELYSMS